MTTELNHCAHSGICDCVERRALSFPPTRYDEDGNSASLWEISCETRWRIRECFKVAFCDLLRCYGEELCEDGECTEDKLPSEVNNTVQGTARSRDCLDSFVCSLITCLPEAICPPEEETKSCCVTTSAPSCKCNFAVGE